MSHSLYCENRLPLSARQDSQRLIEELGPMPREALTAMTDHGLSDVEIGRYFKLGRGTVTSLRQYFNATQRLRHEVSPHGLALRVPHVRDSA